MKLSALSLFLGLLLVSGAGATPLVTWTGAGSEAGHFASVTFGFEFTVGPAGARVSGLGVYDRGSNGFVQDHPVGLWDAGGTLLASTTVTSGDPLTAVGSQGGGFRFATISTLFLAPGRYLLGALYTNVNDFFLFQPSGFSIAPGFTFESARYGEGGSLTRPDTIVNNIGYFGPNLMLAAPELDNGAAGLPLAFVSIALLALSGGRRRN